MTKTSEAANKALAGLVGHRVEGYRGIPLWNEAKHDETPLTEAGKGGEGSGHHGHEGLPGVHGGSRPSIAGSASARVKQHQNRLAREITSHAAAVKRLEEKPFRSPKERLESRKHAKAMRKKLKELDIPEDEVWDVIETMTPQEQAFLASAAKLDANNSKSLKVAKNVSEFLLKKQLQDVAAKHAPSPLIDEKEVANLSIMETTAYLGAYASDPGKAGEFLKALSEGDLTKAHRLRTSGFQDARSNTQKNLRNREWLDIAEQVHGQLAQIRKLDKDAPMPTQREFDKIVSEEFAKRSRDRLQQFRDERGEPRIRFAGFGGQP